MGDDERRSLWDQNSHWWADQYTARDDADYQDVILPFVKDSLSGLGKIIDIGGGEGRLSRYLIEEIGSELTCTDFSFQQMSAGNIKSLRPNFVQAEIARLPFGDGVFDGAVACLVFEHALELMEAVEEVSRVLRPSGKFILILNHPAMQTPESGFVFDHGEDPPSKYWRVSDYLVETSHFEEVEKGVFLPYEHRPISKYVNTLIESGFTIERLYEPTLSDRHIKKNPEFVTIRYIPRLLIIVCSN